MSDPIFTDEQVKIFTKEFSERFAREFVYRASESLSKWIDRQSSGTFMSPMEYFIKLFAKYFGEAVSKKSNGDKQ